jgi:murein DD-endopeptidase MepM/ murein hydrolase activator NlpD
MKRRVVILLACLLVAAAPAAADLGDQQAQVSGQIASLHDRIAAARAREAQLASDISSVTTRIRTLETQVGTVSNRLTTLQRDLDLHRSRLAQIKRLVALQTQQLHLLRGEYHVAVKRLNDRLVQLYTSETPGVVELLLESRSFQDVLDQVDYMNTIATQDRDVARTVAHAQVRVSAARTKAKSTQVSVASEARVIAYRAEQQAALRDELVTNRQALAGARSSKQRDLAATRQQEREWVGEAKSLASVSAQLASQIAGAQSAPSDGGSSPPPSSGGLIWPCAGPITSPFGMRWGSLHPGIDIGAPTGTPIKAAASGMVLTASYTGGYGNLVVLDNGNGIATAYAHQSQIAVSVGETVTQGQVIGYVGSTGFSTGPHLHFEVRVNGSPVDPMGYL